ncbi:hypothetical protein MMC12_004312 [Toensbergia leucococca]|nr:hypothetical protein [Toensbergia leucococca]
MLAPRSVHKFASYTEGWLTVIGWQALCAGAGYLSANLIQGLASLTHPNYHPHPYQVTLLLWAVIVLSVFINAIGGTFLPKFEGLILILHCLGYFAILLPLVVLGEHQNSSQVFDVFLNGGNWPTEGLSFMIGLTGSIFVFVGADGAIHMSEEIVNAAVIVPRSIVFSYTYNGILGFGILLTALFCRGDLDTVLNPPSGYAFIEIFLQATESTTGAAVMTCIITVMQLAASISILTSSSRMLWSFARDHGVPGWRILSKVHQRSTVPIWCVAVTSLISCLLSLINLGSPTAFNDVVSISVAGLYSSYLVALGLLLYRRCTGGIKFSNTSDDSLTNTSGAELTWGPWYLPGAFGIVVNAFACVYLTTALFFTFWPTELPVKADNMNYSVLVLGTVILFSTIHYIFWGKKEYTGPLVEVSRSRG